MLIRPSTVHIPIYVDSNNALSKILVRILIINSLTVVQEEEAVLPIENDQANKNCYILNIVGRGLSNLFMF